MSPLPFHPITNLQAIGFTRRGPVWPVMGGSEDGDPPQAPPQAPPDQPAANADKGFPDNTPIAEMTVEQQAAYYKHQNRQADNKLSAFKGVTPQDVAAMQTRLQELEDKQLNASDKALKDAATKAANDAKAQADAAWQPKYQASQLKSVAAQVITDKDQLASFMAVTDPAKFAGEDGEIDEERVYGHLTAIFATGGQQGNGQRQTPQWGQRSGGNGSPGVRPGDAGKAAAERRHPTKTT